MVTQVRSGAQFCRGRSCPARRLAMFADRIQASWLIGACKKERPVTLNEGVTTLGRFASSLVMEPTLPKHLTAVARYFGNRDCCGYPKFTQRNSVSEQKGPRMEPSIRGPGAVRCRHGTWTRIRFVTLVTPGARQAASSASLRSAHERTVPERMTCPPSSTRT